MVESAAGAPVPEPAPVAGPARSGRRRRAREGGDRPAFYVYAGVMLLALGALFVVGVVAERSQTRSLSLIVAWCMFCAASNVLPVPAVRNVYLSMSSPVNVAIAYLFPPGIAAAIVFGASISEWEIRRQTTPLHALFNRAQLASAAALASFVFTGHRDEVPHAGILVAAVTLYQASNWLFVAMAEWTARGVPLRRVLRGLVPSGVAATATYLALGLMGVVLALTSLEIGVWAVALLMLPLLGARHAVTVSRQLEQAERERRALGDRLIDERERERTRIASDIHDVVLQQLAALQIQADSIGAALDHGRPEVAVRLASQLRRGIDDTIVELRHTIASLRRVAITEGGLVPSLERFARTFRTSAGLDVELSASGVDDDLPLPVALLLFECCQEALTNVARHAGADKVLVGVTRTGDAVELRVADDGQGFDPSATGANRSGLVLTREKVTLAGGMHIVDSRPGTGTTVTVRVPLGSRG